MFSRLKPYRYQVARWWYRKIGTFSKWAVINLYRRKNPNLSTKIMIDNTILDLSISHETRWLSTGKDPFSTRLEDGGYLARVPVHSPSNKTERYRDLTYLNTFGILTRAGFFDVVQSQALTAERIYQPVGRFRGYGMFDSSVLRDISIKIIGEPWFPTFGPSRFQRSSPQAQLRAMINSSPDSAFQNFLSTMKNHMGEKCSQDAWHIWQADKHEVRFFLTTDTKLLAAWKQLQGKETVRNVNVELHSPTSLASRLGFLPTHPIAFSYEQIDAIIRTDVVMPGEQRRPRSRYK